VGKVELLVDAAVESVEALNSRVTLKLKDSAGNKKVVVADHVIAATGYKVDLMRLAFVDSELQVAVKSVENTPVLSSNFESTVPGLYFVGASAANTFGPLLRFAFGARFTARRLSRHLAKSKTKRPIVGETHQDTKTAEQNELAVR